MSNKHVDKKINNFSGLETQEALHESSPLWKIIVVSSIAAGVQFGWALQLSLLTPYVQLLGIPHKWASLIWLCGPISGMLVQPTVGYHSDHCTSRFGRRRPFIAAGAVLVGVAVILIGYSADIGYRMGDPLDRTPKTYAIAVFAVGFWILDVANNTLQGPCRAYMADLAGSDSKKMRLANAFFSFFMAVGNILGFAAGSFKRLHYMFPFTITNACDLYCANLKSCFFLSIILLAVVTVLALYYVGEKQWFPESTANGESCSGEDKSSASSNLPFFSEIFGALKSMEKPMWILLVVTALNWIAWFPFTLFDTDWMGREVFGGDAMGSAAAKHAYDSGVRAGALGLMLNSVVLAVTALGIEPMARALGKVKRLWGLVNFILAFCLAMMVVVTKLAEKHRRLAGSGGSTIPPPPDGVRGGALAIFTVLGVPQAVTYAVPFALASIFTSSSGGGQGLSLAVLNLAIVIPQMIVSVVAGPFDALFGGGNLPSFVAGAICAVISGILALTILPSPPPDAATPKSQAMGFH